MSIGRRERMRLEKFVEGPERELEGNERGSELQTLTFIMIASLL
jgi:hypothetical protein